MTDKIPLTPRQIIDPHGTLPEVSLIADPEARIPGGTLRPNSMLIVHDDKVIGKATLTEELKRKYAWFNGVRIDEEYRGKGFGMATYIAAIEHAHSNGETFRTHDWTQTEAAAKVWTQFITSGVAEVIEPFTLITDGENQGKYIGHAEIRPEILPTSIS